MAVSRAEPEAVVSAGLGSADAARLGAGSAEHSEEGPTAEAPPRLSAERSATAFSFIRSICSTPSSVWISRAASSRSRAAASPRERRLFARVSSTAAAAAVAPGSGGRRVLAQARELALELEPFRAL